MNESVAICVHCIDKIAERAFFLKQTRPCDRKKPWKWGQVCSWLILVVQQSGGSPPIGANFTQ